MVNFSAIEAFFSEKRPFFTENQALFAGDLPNGDRLVHTRRIGAAGDAGDEPVTEIDAAAKATVYGRRLDYGAFAVVEDDAGLSEGGNYASTRIQARVGGAAIGHGLTWADRPTLERTALVNSLDLDWPVSPEVRLEGQWMYSLLEQDANEFNGGTDLDDGDVGGYGRFRYTPGEQWQHTFTGFYYGDEFDMNDLGFLQRNDYLLLQGGHRYEVLDYGAASAMRSSVSQLNYNYEENSGGERLLPWMELTHEITFDSTRKFETKAWFQAAGSDDLISRGNGLVRIPQQQGVVLEYTSRRDTRLGFSAELEIGNDGTDEYSTELGLEGQYYLLDTLTLSGGASVRDYREWLLWDFSTAQMATYEADQYEVDFRLDWYPSTRQEVRLKLQWVAVSAEALAGFDIGQGGRLQESGVPASDFSVSDTAVQLRYRYELAPLSDIFLVYSRGGFWGDAVSDQGPGSMFQRGWDEKNAEVILAKIRYRF